MVGIFRNKRLLAALLWAAWPCLAIAVEDGSKTEFFELHIRPVLVEKCASCHDGGDNAESVLTLAGREALLEGGDFGPAIVPGKANRSLLWRAINGTHKELRMPPDEDEALTREQVAAFEKWINNGAPWPEGKPIVSSDSKTHKPEKTAASAPKEWGFPPLKQIDVPQIQDGGWARSDIDRFISQKLQEQSLQPAASADRRTLVRRMYFDLIGLPPTPEQMKAALADDSPGALAKVVDDLLASRHYGERWGRHWLDVARYADTQGDVGDFPIPGAYRYRNWVINALNDDMPYDRFVQLQLAGDLFARDVDDLQERKEMTVATGFLALSRRFGNKKEDDIHLTIEDSIDTIGRGIMGVTLRCARCHDHKFDPMAMDDYYGLYGILASTRYPWMGMSNQKSPSELVPGSPTADAQQKTDEYWALISRYEYQINNHFRPWLKPTINKYNGLKKQRDEAAAKGEETESIDAEINDLLDKNDKFRELLVHKLAWVRRERDRLASNPPFEMLFAVSEGEAHDAKLHRRGNPEQPGDVVPRGFVASLGGNHPAGLDATSGRRELAQWITAAEHPLTSRVIVNRVWQHHFGRGLVATASNFGLQGTPPSHPELLDYLAQSFIADGWSLKKLHRRIMLSQVYQSSSEDLPANIEQDPDNIYLWKYGRRRLEAEAIRDSMLAVSGELDRSTGGEHPFPAWQKKRYSLNDPFKAVYPSSRRSVYVMTQRLFKHPLLGLFDGPDRNTTTDRRDSSSVATQALFLMNSPFIDKQAAAFGKRIEAVGATDEQRIEAGYQLAFARPATDTEVETIGDFFAQYREAAIAGGASVDDANQKAISSFAKVLLTSNEFIFVD